ncbi:class I SAM-dependent methyltransferase [Halorubellus sp. JP-L1]|uniref:small ribosomal subunit Rsm22 family protein n=1 Tax=Halorubellus sp. JP-L1 TaxID=2715753 RepID=UPI00140B5A3A|nr:class I SAM-dependent methyltransferase [Halorubellus sp. JP-L1]
MTDRDAIRNNAKYLQHVRPIDPEKICEYVDGHPHPAVVKRILHEEALDLGLVQRADGTFVPVSDDPVPHREGTVERFPIAYARTFEDELVAAYGPDWHRGDSGDALRTTIRRLKDDYFHQRDVTYDERAALAYGCYHLPDFYAAIQYVLRDLTEKHLLDHDLRILDVGAGVGGPALGINDALPDDALVDYHALEPSANADVLETMLAETGDNFHTTVHRDRAEAVDPTGIDIDGSADNPSEFDLVLFANVLNELEDPESVLETYANAVADDGALVALAPADENTATGLRTAERAVVQTTDATVYSPTVRLWAGQEPTDHGWTFDVKPDLDVPEFQRRLDDATPESDTEHTPGEFVNVDVQYAYSILRRDGARRLDVTASSSKYARMADTESHVPNRIKAIAVKLSHDLTDRDDANPLYKVGDGSQGTDHYAVLTNETALNDALAYADYGDLLTFDGVLALWNDDEQAYNLVVDEQTTVDHAPAPL